MNPPPGKFGINLSGVGFAPFARGGEAPMKNVKALDADRIDDIDVTTTAVAETRSALQRGARVTVQAALVHEGWNGRAEVLRRVEAPTRIAANDLAPAHACCHTISLRAKKSRTIDLSITLVGHLL